MSYKIFVINPGSTSTKVAYFEDDKKLLEENVFHDAPELAKFATINDQLPYRMQVILDFINNNNLDLTGIDAIVGRGGCCYPLVSGVYEITDQLLSDTVNAKAGVNHPSNLGPQLARELQKLYGGRAFIVDGPMTDEFEDVARITGIAGVYRASHLHVLNLKGTIKLHCEKMGVKYEDGNYIVCHIDGGMSITAHEHGRMIDGTDAAGGEGPFTPTRCGNMDAFSLIDYLKDHDFAATRKMCGGAAGLASHFGTSNADKIHKLVEQGDKKACLIWEAMIYNICKQIGAMAAVLKGNVDGIVLGGGLLRFDDIAAQIKDRCEWIAPVTVYPGEVEHEAMAAGALRVLKGQEELKVYTGDPGFRGI